VKGLVDSGRSVRVLLVEDNPADVRLLREALADVSVAVELVVAGDGEEAVRLMEASLAEPQLRPDLVLLDLNLPRMTGAEVLAEVKANPALRRIPVLVLSGSGADHDVRNAYDLHANAYMRKPHDYPGLRQLMLEIERFWLEHALLPLG
jgi:chemotaxis family two-component system response regulator Rcp1